jgi:hypothetical protein
MRLARILKRHTSGANKRCMPRKKCARVDGDTSDLVKGAKNHIGESGNFLIVNICGEKNHYLGPKTKNLEWLNSEHNIKPPSRCIIIHKYT